MPHYEKCGKNAGDQLFRLGIPDPHRLEPVMTLYMAYYNNANILNQLLVKTIDGED